MKEEVMEGNDDIDLGADDPLAGVPADPTVVDDPDPLDVSAGPEEERLGGEGEVLQDPEAESEEEPEDPAESGEAQLRHDDPLRDVDEAAAADDTPPLAAVPDPPAEGQTDTDPPIAETPETEPETEPEPPAEDPPAEPPATEPEKPKSKTPMRQYVVLQNDGSEKDPKWVVPKGLKTGIEARNGEGALRDAYRKLSPSGEDDMKLVVVPVNYFKPKTVKGRKREDYAIDIS